MVRAPALTSWLAAPLRGDVDTAEPSPIAVGLDLLALSLAAAAAVVGVLGTGAAAGRSWVVLVLAVLALAVPVSGSASGAAWLSARTPGGAGLLPVGRSLLSRVVLVGAIGVSAHRSTESTWLVALTLAGSVAALLVEQVLVRVLRLPTFVATGLPGLPRGGPRRIEPSLLPTASVAGLLLAALVGALGAPVLIALLAALLWLVLALAILLENVLRYLTALRAHRRLPKAMAAFAPAFAVYAGRREDASYQVAMWLEYLQRTDRRFVIIARGDQAAQILAERTDVPVVYCRTSADIERILTPSLRAVFYVNAASSNGQVVRHQNLTHVHLGHGDSDKATSYNPTHAMYDYIFCAGPAAVQRYAAHGVRISPEKFVQVGRPQVEVIAAERVPPGPGRVVLYAPTWRGHVDETALYSLPCGEQLVRGLLEAEATVVFRPHPFNADFPADRAVVARIDALLARDAERTGRRHIWGARASTQMSTFDCFDACDAMVSDVSGVASDFLASGKPMAMYVPAAFAGESQAQFAQDFPLARAAYLVEAELGNLAAVLGDALGADPLAAERGLMRAHYLGDRPQEGYAQEFVLRVREVADGVLAPAHERIDFGTDTVPARGDSDPAGLVDADTEIEGGAGAATDEIEDGSDLTPVRATQEPPSQRPEPGTGGAAPAGRSIGGISRAALLALVVPQGIAAGPPAFALLAAAAGLVGASGVGGALAAVALAGLTWSLWGTPDRVGTAPGSWASVRVLVALALLASPDVVAGSALPAGLALLAVVLAVGLEGWTAALQVLPVLRVRNLPGLGYAEPTRALRPWAFAATLATLWLAVLSRLWGPLRWPCAVLAALALLLGARELALAVRRYRAQLAATGRLKATIAAYRPRFVLYFASRSGAGYQVGTWLPYLERIGARYLVVTRSEASMRELAGLTSAPVVLCRTLGSLQDTIAPTLRVAFYPNNGTTNTHYIEHRELTHVWLNHGDSEKPACFNPVHAIYDLLFTAGQAGIDRYVGHGVLIPAEKFQIVGRPQVSAIHRAEHPIADIRAPRVLYAPTWAGLYDDSVLYSLPIGPRIVAALLERGCSVLFRPHPLNRVDPAAMVHVRAIWALLERDRREAGRPHIWGAAAETERTSEDCFNDSEAMISDVSALLTDYLQSQKPFSVVAVDSASDRLLQQAPVARAAYPLLGDLSNLSQVLDDLLADDPLATLRGQTKAYYLGEFADADPAAPFLRAARRLVTGD